jgi:membrane fusion protein (multidrug efflux system)
LNEETMSATAERPSEVGRSRPTAPPEAATAPPAAPAPAPHPAAPRPNRIPVIVLGTLALIGLVFGFNRWRWGLTHVSTDDAQVEGHIVPTLARVNGFVAEVAVRENDRVTLGQLLVRLDDREFATRLAQAEADVQSALAAQGVRGHVGQAEAQLAAARAAVVQAEANATRAQQDLERAQRLAARGIVSSAQLDAAVTGSAGADAALDAARKQVQAAEAGLSGASARVNSVQAARDRAALDLGYTHILAPCNGVVSRKTVEVGQYVQAGQALMSVVPLDDIWVVANLKETEIRDVTPGDKAEIEVDAYPGRKFGGHVESLSPATGARFSLLPPDNATGNFTKVVQRIPVRIHVDGPIDPLHPLRPGMSVNATVVTK